jgi:DnaJ-class molecular chaperone
LVKGEGMPILWNQKAPSFGNLYIRFDIIFPKQLSEDVKGKLRKLL